MDPPIEVGHLHILGQDGRDEPIDALADAAERW